MNTMLAPLLPMNELCRTHHVLVLSRFQVQAYRTVLCLCRHSHCTLTWSFRPSLYHNPAGAHCVWYMLLRWTQMTSLMISLLNRISSRSRWGWAGIKETARKWVSREVSVHQLESEVNVLGQYHQCSCPWFRWSQSLSTLVYLAECKLPAIHPHCM